MQSGVPLGVAEELEPTVGLTRVTDIPGYYASAERMPRAIDDRKLEI